MNRGQSTRVARVEELQKIERFAPSNFPQQNTIGPMPQRGFEKVTNGDSGYAVLFSSGFEANEVSLSKLYFSCVFDQQDALVRGNELPQGIQQRGLVRRGSITAEETKTFFQAELVFLAVVFRNFAPIARHMARVEF